MNAARSMNRYALNGVKVPNNKRRSPTPRNRRQTIQGGGEGGVANYVSNGGYLSPTRARNKALNHFRGNNTIVYTGQRFNPNGELAQEYDGQHEFSITSDLGEDQDTAVSRLLQSIFEDAVMSKASDIHIEPNEDVLRIRHRVDGVLQENIIHQKNIANALVLRLKLMAGLDISERRLPQDGRAQMTIKNKLIDIRLSTMGDIENLHPVGRIEKTGFKSHETLGDMRLKLGMHGEMGEFFSISNSASPSFFRAN